MKLDTKGALTGVLIAIILILSGFYIGQNFGKEQKNLVNFYNMSYNNIIGLNNLTSTEIKDCNTMYSEIIKEADKLNYCSSIADCSIKDDFNANGIFTCGIYHNKNADFGELMSLLKNYKNSNCPFVIAGDCYPIKNYDIKCERGKCGISISKETGSVCGNGICETGEAQWCPQCVIEQTCRQPCGPEPGNCPQDCSQ